MQLQRQHFLLSYFKTLSVGPAGVELTTSRMTAPCSTTEPLVCGFIDGEKNNERQILAWFLVCNPTVTLFKATHGSQSHSLSHPDFCSWSGWKVFCRLPCGQNVSFLPPKTLSEILLFLSSEKTERQGQVLNHNFEISQGLLSIQYTSDFFNYLLIILLINYNYFYFLPFFLES